MVTTTSPADSAPIFVDTNVLIYADLAPSPFHSAARQRLTDLHSAGTRLWVSQQVLREYLVALTRGQSFAKPVPPADAATAAEQIAAQFWVAQDTTDTGRILVDLVRRFDVKGKQVHDANIVATMIAHRIPRLLTHNTADFTRFSSLIDVVPLLP